MPNYGWFASSLLLNLNRRALWRVRPLKWGNPKIWAHPSLPPEVMGPYIQKSPLLGEGAFTPTFNCVIEHGKLTHGTESWRVVVKAATKANFLNQHIIIGKALSWKWVWLFSLSLSLSQSGLWKIHFRCQLDHESNICGAMKHYFGHFLFVFVLMTMATPSNPNPLG